MGGFWHILNRGVAKTDIFRCKEDYNFQLYKLKESLAKYPVGIHAFNLLSNHVHYLIEQTADNVSPSKFIASVHTGLGSFINRKHSRVGHLFQDRCKVKTIEGSEHLLAISVYVNLNKILEELQRADSSVVSKNELKRMLKEAESDPWSSYPVFLGLRQDGITQPNFILSLLSDDIGKARKEYKKFAEKLLVSGYFVKTRGLSFE